MDKLLKKQLKGRFNKLMIASVLLIFIMSSISSVQSRASDQESITNDQATSSQGIAVNAMTVVGSGLSINKIDLIPSSAGDYYEVESTYMISTNDEDLTVELRSRVNAQTQEVNTLNKRIRRNNGDVLEEEQDELFLICNNELVTLSNIDDKEHKQKMLVNAVEPLVERERFRNTKLPSKQMFVVQVKKNSNLPFIKKLISTDNFDFNIVELSDLSTFISNGYVIKLSEAKEGYLKKFIEYSKEVLRSESEEKIRELELKRTMLDVVEVPQLLNYMSEDEWNVQQGQTSAYQQFVTPSESIIKEIGIGITPQEAYELAIDWVWVSDSILNGKAEKWLLPKEFLSNTPNYNNNPVPGKVASDCSEQANTLVSILRASGVSAEDVRVALGEVNFDGNVGGHAWVEIKENGKWMVLDPTCGPYYDDETGSLINRNGVNYQYWKYHPYPVEEIWVYYNDAYFTDENEEVAHGWATQYDVFTGADMFAGFIPEESIDFIFVSVATAAIAIIFVFFLGRAKKK